jgi:hypothetical protein
MELLARTRIVMWEGGGLWLVDATPTAGRERKQTEFHAHHAIQIVIGLGGDFRLQTRSDQVGGEVVAVAADVPHAFAAEGLLALLFVEPESRIGRALSARLFVGRHEVPSRSPARDLAGPRDASGEDCGPSRWRGPVAGTVRSRHGPITHFRRERSYRSIYSA